MQLAPTARDAGMRLIALATIDSTNKRARALARQGERGPLWITAAEQTEGRGRSGRSWLSPPGNLYATLLLCDPSPFERAPELAFVAALAVRDAIVTQAPALAPQLAFKWPNDLLLAGGKCAGILIEGEAAGPNSVSVVIGIGVNCDSHPATEAPTATSGLARPLLYLATDLRAHGAAATPERLFEALSGTMCRRLAQWDSGRGFAVIRDDWLAAARGIGEPIRVRNGTGEKTGRFAGLDRSGRLLLDLADGAREAISAGDVFSFARQDDGVAPTRQAE